MDQDLTNAVENKESFHLNSLITKNISLFTKDPNYKMLTWLIVQLTIFSLFILCNYIVIPTSTEKVFPVVKVDSSLAK